MIDETNVVGKTNIRSSKSEMGLFTLEARLAFTKLR